MPATFAQKVRGRLVSILILCIAVGLILLLSSTWTTWAVEGELQNTDNAYLHVDVSPLSTKAAGVEVSDYQVETGLGARRNTRIGDRNLIRAVQITNALLSLTSCAARDVSASRFQTGRTPKSISRSPDDARQRFC